MMSDEGWPEELPLLRNDPDGMIEACKALIEVHETALADLVQSYPDLSETARVRIVLSQIFGSVNHEVAFVIAGILISRSVAA